jgi:hypothetical protein
MEYEIFLPPPPNTSSAANWHIISDRGIKLVVKTHLLRKMEDDDEVDVLGDFCLNLEYVQAFVCMLFVLTDI